MKTLSRTAAGVVAAALLVSAAPAQGPSQEELRDRFEKKLALEFIETGGWITDFGVGSSLVTLISSRLSISGMGGPISSVHSGLW